MDTGRTMKFRLPIAVAHQEKLLKHLAYFILRVIRKCPLGEPFDKYYSLARFVAKHGRFPRRRSFFNDVLFFRKWDGDLDDDLIRLTTDKEFSKLFISHVLGKKFIIPTIATLKTDREIENFAFPSECYVKGTCHSGAVICISGGNVNREEIKTWLKSNHYKSKREQNYRGLTPKVIVEAPAFGNPTAEDFKFFAVLGTVNIIQVDFDRNVNHTRKLYTRDWNSLNCSIEVAVSSKEMEKPGCLREMIEAAEEIGKHFNFIRVDMFTDGSKFVIGELTHCHGSADQSFIPKESEGFVSGVLFDSICNINNLEKGDADDA